MNNLKLSFWLLIVALLLIVVTLVILRKNMINIKFAILWLVPSTVLIIFTFFPNVFISLANLFGFLTISNLIVGLILVIVLFLIMTLTIIITDLNKKSILLIQEVSILKKKLSEIENKSEV